jgi:hypothetical protein
MDLPGKLTGADFEGEPVGSGVAPILENPDDEAMILADDDESERSLMDPSEQENQDESGSVVDPDFDHQPAPFVRGEVDVKTQMDRSMAAAQALAGKVRHPEYREDLD